MATAAAAADAAFTRAAARSEAKTTKDAPQAHTLDELELSAKQLQIFESLYSELVDSLGHSLVLYDGVCLVCNAYINFVVDHDPDGIFHFVPLQAPFAQYVRARHQIPAMDSIFLVDASANRSATAPKDQPAEWFCKSTAILRIVTRLAPKWLFALAWVLMLLPLFVRDTAYDLFASWRYRVFGKLHAPGDESAGSGAQCRPVTRATRPRFLEYVIKDREKQWDAAQRESQTAATMREPLVSSRTDAQQVSEIQQQSDVEVAAEHGHVHSTEIVAHPGSLQEEEPEGGTSEVKRRRQKEPASTAQR